MSKHGVVVTPQANLGACCVKQFVADGNGVNQMRGIRIDTAFVACVWQLLSELDLTTWAMDDLGNLFIEVIPFDELTETIIDRIRVMRPEWMVTAEHVECAVTFLDSLNSDKFVIPVPQEVSMMVSALA